MSLGDREIERIATSQHGAIARSQAVEAGFSHAMMRYRRESGLWLPTRFDDVYRLAATPPTWRQELWTGSLWGGPEALIAGRSAAALYGMERCPEGPLELLLPLHAKHRAPRGVRVRRSNHPVRARELDGLRVTDPETTLLGVARGVRTDVLDDVLESAFDLGLTTPDRTLAAIGRRAGSGPIRRLLVARQPGRPRQSRLEGAFFRLATAAGYEVVRQYEIEINGRLYVMDYAVPLVFTGIELDGLGKLRTKEGKRRFLERSTQLQIAGWRLLHFGWHDVNDRPEYVLESLAAARIG